MGQTVVVLGGHEQRQGDVNSVLVLHLAQPTKQWRPGPPMNQKRAGHAAVVCNGAVYVMGGNHGATLDCIERIHVQELLQSSLATIPSNNHNNKKKSHNWTTLTIRLSTKRYGCCAVAVHNRYIVVMGGHDGGQRLSSVDILDTTRNHIVVTAGPSMTVARSFCASAVVGHRILVVGGETEHHELDSVEYWDIANERTVTFEEHIPL